MIRHLFKLKNKNDEVFKLIDNLPIPAFLKNAHNIIIFANKAFFELLKIENKNDYSKLSEKFYSSLNIEEITKEDYKILNYGGNIITNKEIYNVNKKVKNTYTIYKTAVSERKKEIAVFIKNCENNNLEENNKNIIATLTHDLKTPAIAQIRAIELLLKGNYGEINETQRSFLNDILNSCNNMLDMLINMLWLYKFDNKRIAINITSFNINDLIKDIFKENKLILNSKQHRFKFNYRASRIYIKADRMHIKRIISNLIMNAINHSSENSNIYIETDIECGKFIFRVKNEGNYLNEETLNCIFDKDKVFTQKTDGLSTGLGLYLTNSLLELNGGHLLYSSLPDGINMFGFSINLSCNNNSSDLNNQISNYKF